MNRDPGQPPPAHGGTAIQPAPFRPPSSAPALPRLRLPWAKLLALAIVVTAGWSAWFVLTARSVVIMTEPPGADVAVDQRIAPYLNGRWLLRPGPRRLRIDAPGYVPYREALVITDEPLQTHTIKLKPLPGHLRVAIASGISAQIHIDGELAGTAPATVRDIEAGNHELELTADRHLPYEGVIEIEGRGIEQVLEIDLKPAWAEVTISSQPQGAEVLVAGAAVGMTPVTVEILQGRHEFVVQKAGYKTWQHAIDIVAGKTINLPEIMLARADGYLMLETRPRGANITVDGTFKGQSPAKVALTPDTLHEISVYIDGYEPEQRSLTVGSGRTEKLELELKPELGTIHIVTTPSDAELLVDGEPRGSATQTLSLPTHEHEIMIRKPGYATYKDIVTPRKGVAKRYKVRLKTQAELDRESAGAAVSADGVVRTGVGQELKLFHGGDFTLGTSRRDQDRRANEVVKKVALKRPFYFGLREVSNGQYRRFLGHHTVAPVGGNQMNDDDQPVVNITWEAAAAYCNWLSREDSLPVFYQIKHGKVLGVNPDATGYRLPTEAEWAWVARIPPKGEPFVYPWGDTYPPRGKSGNYADLSATSVVEAVIPNYNDGYAVTAPVGSYPPNLRGIYDLGGNVAEWVHDYYDISDTGGEVSVDPLGPAQGGHHVIRGSSWSHASATELRLAFRDYGDKPRTDVGFRLARYAQ